MDVCRHVLLGTIIAATGCSVPGPAPQLCGSGGNFRLSQQDMQFSQALAHYGQGLLLAVDEPADIEGAEYHMQAAAKLSGETLPTREAALLAVRNGHPQRAVDLLSKHADDVADPRLYCDLAAAHRLLGNMDDALDAYKQALAIVPENTAIYLSAASTAFQAAQPERALALLDNGMAQANRPGLIRLYVDQQARAFLESKRLADSASLLGWLVANDPQRRAYYYQRMAHISLLQEDLEGAIESMEQAIDKDASPDLYIQLAALQLGDHPNAALVTLDKGLVAFPSNAILHFSRATALAELKDYAQADVEFDRTRQLLEASSPDETQRLGENYYLRHGAVCDQGGNTAKAEQIFEEGIRNNPRSSILLNYLAYLWAEGGTHLDKAMAYVDRALEIEPENPAYLDTRAWIFYKQNRYTEALADVRRALALMGEDEPEILLHLGDILNARGNTHGACAAWQKAAVSNPDFPGVQERLDRCKASSGPTH